MNKLLITFFTILNGIYSFSQYKVQLQIHLPLNNLEIELKPEDSSFTTIKMKAFNKAVVINKNINQKFGVGRLLIKDNLGDLLFEDLIVIEEGHSTLRIERKSTSEKYELLSSSLNIKKRYDKILQHYTNQIHVLEKESFYYQNSKDSITIRKKKIFDNKINSLIEFVEENSNNYFALFIFYKEIVSNINGILRVMPSTLSQLLSLFNCELLNTSIGKQLTNEINKRLALSVSSQMPLFRFRDDSLNENSLEELVKKKYVILAFWDSGCKPCIESFPVFRDFYSRFASKLEIISISLDNNERRWKKSLEKHNLPWINTCNLPDFIDESNVDTLYDIQFIPQYFLLDQTGKLIYHNIQSNDNDNYSVLEKILISL